MKRWDDAEAAYGHTVRTQPDHVGAINNLGIVLMEKRTFDEACKCFREALHLRADYAEAHNNLGIALLELKMSEEAADSLEQALRLRPAYPEALNNLGNVRLQQGRYVGAVVRLAGDIGRLAELRATLREKMSRSPLLDGVRFTRHVETAYRWMWEKCRAASD